MQIFPYRKSKSKGGKAKNGTAEPPVQITKEAAACGSDNVTDNAKEISEKSTVINMLKVTNKCHHYFGYLSECVLQPFSIC